MQINRNQDNLKLKKKKKRKTKHNLKQQKQVVTDSMMKKQQIKERFMNLLWSILKNARIWFVFSKAIREGVEMDMEG